jgi:hypothetical protein
LQVFCELATDDLRVVGEAVAQCARPCGPPLVPLDLLCQPLAGLLEPRLELVQASLPVFRSGQPLGLRCVHHALVGDVLGELLDHQLLERLVVRRWRCPAIDLCQHLLVAGVAFGDGLDVRLVRLGVLLEGFACQPLGFFWTPVLDLGDATLAVFDDLGEGAVRGELCGQSVGQGLLTEVPEQSEQTRRSVAVPSYSFMVAELGIIPIPSQVASPGEKL